ncbi:Hypothetical Protein OBI_RACECAR_245 [Arthrobacter phage Racecar]|nr:hypothetical protein PBI_RACECAR_37 [Arthrobacter phage Racecar]QFG12721.1 hypothetical protein PBI_MIMI_37 [Arthrobacter phage Mimi]
MFDYPVVSTVEEFDALLFGSVILDCRYRQGNGLRPWTKVDLRWGDGTPNTKQWASFNAKYRDADMLLNRRGRGQKYWVIFTPTPDMLYVPEEEEEENDNRSE